MYFYPKDYQESEKIKVNPRAFPYLCGWCGRDTNGRLIASDKLSNDGEDVLFCQCQCAYPTVIVFRNYSGQIIYQYPEASHFISGDDWPEDLSSLFSEASKAFSAKAYTTCAMACRKILMSCACDKGAEEGKNFAYYVTYITDEVIKYESAKDSIDEIRNIGNDANHKIQFVSKEKAEHAMKIISYLLNSTYSLPNIGKQSNKKAQRT